MDGRTENQLGIALRYLCAVLPMLFYGVILAVVVSQDRDRLAWALADVGLGVIGLVLIRWRRRRPWQTALATALLTVFSTTATGPAQVAYVSLGTHRRWRQFIPVMVVSWLCLVARSSWNGVNQATVVSVVTGTVVLGGLAVFGLYLRGRRDLAVSQREAALAAGREQLQRIEQAKLAERAKIAQEMHDVLAHRISLLSMLAGGLAYRTDLTAEETRETALAIQENAHQSLNELRGVLGTLRSDGALEAPQPNLAHVDALFDEVRAAGQQVEVDDTIDDRELLPTQTGRHAYRIVQEALTNARKHAPGSRVTAELGGRPGDGLRIRVSNPAPAGTSAGPGGRLGLIGLAERTRMAGGTISHAVQNGRFVLDVRLPWEA
ncbi:histidine kinase [Streptosporangium sp. NPDC049644]|uniref:sensor histidine kinase n=1 Tax=Streptosporangium sp. NPDC049644 TaxID=3155507 RepID=UPI00343FD45A